MPVPILDLHSHNDFSSRCFQPLQRHLVSVFCTARTHTGEPADIIESERCKCFWHITRTILEQVIKTALSHVLGDRPLTQHNIFFLPVSSRIHDLFHVQSVEGKAVTFQIGLLVSHRVFCDLTAASCWAVLKSCAGEDPYGFIDGVDGSQFWCCWRAE